MAESVSKLKSQRRGLDAELINHKHSSAGIAAAAADDPREFKVKQVWSCGKSR